MRIKKEMTVRVNSGNHKGMEGKVLRVFPDKNRVIINFQPDSDWVYML